MSEFSPADNTVFGLYANEEFADCFRSTLGRGRLPIAKERIALPEHEKAQQQIYLWMEPGASRIWETREPTVSLRIAQ